jgi:predicted lipoprotein with Yx(FWY)xxD motif
MTLSATNKKWLALLAVGVLTVGAAFGAACSDDDDGDSDGNPTTAATSAAGDATEPAGDETEPAGDATEPAASGDLTITTAEDPTLGTILVDSRGFTLYTFTSDTAGSQTSACLEGCATAWPPLTVDGQGDFDDEIGAKVTTFERPEGTTQVAYDGMPLYFFASDAAPGDTNGHEVGGVWFVATP